MDDAYVMRGARDYNTYLERQGVVKNPPFNYKALFKSPLKPATVMEPRVGFGGGSGAYKGATGLSMMMGRQREEQGGVAAKGVVGVRPPL